MESRFGHDFSRVRVHTDARAAQSARAVDALAYTVGRDVVFAAGQYAPGTRGGKRLLAHEMTHVLQQSTSGDSPRLRFGGAGRDQYEVEAEAAAAQVINATPQQPSLTLASRPAPVSLMRSPDGDAPAPKTCDPPQGKGKQPDAVSQILVDRWMGKYAKEGDPGEGCREEPYVAGKTERVCTIGYGIQLPSCPVLSRATGAAPTAEEISKVAKAEPPEFMCACAGKEHVDCKGSQAEELLRTKASPKVKHVHDVVPVDLDQAQFDALVDIAMHRGSVPSELLDPIKKYWCTDAGKDYVRGIYLKTALQPFPEAFAARRKFRVWPPSISGLSTRGQSALEEAGKALEDPNVSQKSRRAALDQLWGVVGGIEQHQKRGFRDEEEKARMLRLKRELLQKIGSLTDAASRGA
jgi:GH24 family phage-related lysozyme (muramidase)